LNLEFNQEGPPAAASSAKRVGESLERLYTGRFYAHALGHPNPVEIRTADIEKGV
jgi:hypothetical protein